MIEIRRSEPSERDALYQLWATVFEEDLPWLDRFFATRYNPEHIYLATVDGKLTSSLHALPATYVKNGVEKGCVYIVGAATDAAYRRQGLMGRLLERVKEQSEHPVTLFPAVRPFYEGHGYQTTSVLLSFVVEGSHRVVSETPLPSWQVFDDLYRAEHSEAGFLVRDETAWEFLIGGYESVAVEGAYALIKDGVAIEAIAADTTAATSLIALLGSKGVTAVQALASSPIARLFGLKEGVPIPMGMSTELAMDGVYIAEQY